MHCCWSDLQRYDWCRHSLVDELQSQLCAGPDSLAGQAFEVDRLHVWHTPAGQTDAWQHVQEIRLA